MTNKLIIYVKKLIPIHYKLKKKFSYTLCILQVFNYSRINNVFCIKSYYLLVFLKQTNNFQ